MERAALSRRPPGSSGAGALTMEQAKISSARGTPAAQPTRAPAPVVADADDGTPATGFAAWLAALAAVADGKAPEPGAGADGSPSGLAASDAADGGGHALTLAGPRGGGGGAAGAPGGGGGGPRRAGRGGGGGVAGGGDRPDGSDGPPGADDGLTAWAALTALAALTAVTALTQGGRPQGLVAETARLDGGADLKDAPPPGLGAGWGHVLARLQNAQIRRAAGIGAFDAVAGAPGQSDPSAPSGPSGPSAPWSVGDALQRLTAAHGAGAALAPAAGAGLAQQPQSAGATARHGAAGLATGAAAAARAARLAEAAPGMPASAPGPGSVVAARADAAPANAGGAWPEGASLRMPGDGAPAPGAGASPGANPRGAGGQDLMAHQVAYWVQPKIQSAQLTLQREGQAVEVRVSLSGNQAHVSFGSDQPHSRELLDQGQAQLSDLLRSEGLVLSGMSVGMTAGEGAAGQGAGPPQRPRAGAGGGRHGAPGAWRRGHGPCGGHLCLNWQPVAWQPVATNWSMAWFGFYSGDHGLCAGSIIAHQALAQGTPPCPSNPLRQARKSCSSASSSARWRWCW